MYKKIILLMVFFCAAIINVSAQREKLDQLFNRYEGTEGVFSIKIAKPMFGILNKLDISGGELDQIKPLLNKINGLKILILEKPELPQSLGSEDKRLLTQNEKIETDISTTLKGLNYEELMSLNSRDNKIKFLSAGAKDGILDDLLINISADDNTILMMLDGKISMDDVNKLIDESQNFGNFNSSNSSENSKVINRDSEERNLASFTGIEASTGIRVNFTQGKNQEVRVETDEDKLQYISTVVQGNILKISIKNPANKKLNFNKILVTIVAPELKQIKTTSGSSLTVLNTLKTDNISIESTSGSIVKGDFEIKNVADVEVTSGANLDVNMNVNQLNFEGTSGSNATINGKASQANFELTSAANCNAQNLEVKNAISSATSAANLTVNVSNELNAEASSGGKIRYKGNPTISSSNISKISGGSLVKF